MHGGDYEKKCFVSEDLYVSTNLFSRRESGHPSFGRICRSHGSDPEKRNKPN